MVAISNVQSRHVAGLDVPEEPRQVRVRPFVDLHQQFGDLAVRQQHRRLVDQGLCFVGLRCVQGRDLQAGFGCDGRVRQSVVARDAVGPGEWLLQPQQPLTQVLFAVGGDSQRQFTGQPDSFSVANLSAGIGYSSKSVNRRLTCPRMSAQ